MDTTSNKHRPILFLMNCNICQITYIVYNAMLEHAIGAHLSEVRLLKVVKMCNQVYAGYQATVVNKTRTYFWT